ncbi:AbiH family protein [Sphingobacterium sp. LRF_L2]|uniref:AbiH family protein n=1 Tax=Sphingobacterium sp. LRF_L2 TaxID=3369421 RepID=UPI003F62C44A
MTEDPKYNSKLFLIGNGFDLGHGLKTSYLDFIKWYLREVFESAKKSEEGYFSDGCLALSYNSQFFIGNDPKLLKAELDLSDSLENKSLLKLLAKSEHIKFDKNYFSMDTSIGNTLRIYPKNSFVRNILTICFDDRWSGIEDQIYRIVRNELKYVKDEEKPEGASLKEYTRYMISVEKIISVNESINCLKTRLIQYLNGQNIPEGNRYNWFDKILASHLRGEETIQKNAGMMILNFNYTTHTTAGTMVSDLKAEYGKFYPNMSTNYIHGNLDDHIDEIVFGVGDEANGFYEEVERECGDEWLQCMKSFNYFRNNRYQELLAFINGPIPYEIYILGHSCSITDRTLLKMIFEHENCKSINIFHYRGMDSYIKTAYNVARNFSDKVKMRNVVKPFDTSLSMK